MSYQVMARAYRPQNFSEVLGQEHITRTLTNIIKSDRIGHAYLFSGTRGVGKTSVARIFSKALNCEKPKDYEPCNECSICKEITASSSMDIVEIDGASNNGVAAIRDLIEQVNYLPTSGKYKIYLIDEVHMLTESAFNALLKTLEEPPPHVIFIFATTEIHQIPATILSRCQKFHFRKVSLREISSHLRAISSKEEIEVSEQGLSIIAREARGSFRDALSIFDQILSFSGKKISDAIIEDSIGIYDQNIIFDTVKSILEGNYGKILNTIKKISESGFDVKTFLTAMLETFRHLITIKIHTESKSPSLNEKEFEELLDLPSNEIEDLKGLKSQATDKDLFRIFTNLSEAAPFVISSNSPEASLEVLLLRLAFFKSSGIPVTSLLQKLENLEKDIINKNIQFKAAPIQRSIQVEEPQKKNEILKQEKIAIEATRDKTNPMLSSWEILVGVVKQKKPLLAASLIEGALVEIKDSEYKIIYKNDNFSYKQVSDEANKKEIERILSQNLNKEVKLNFTLEVNSAGVTLGDVIKKREIEKKKENMDLATSHPNITKVKEILGAEIVKVIMDEEND